MKNFLVAVWFSLFVGLVAYFLATYGEMPARFAVHFDGSGHPDGWAEKESFRTMFLVFTFAMNAMTALLFFFMPRFPKRLINIPNKDYFFETEERTAVFFEKVRVIPACGGIFINFICLLVYDSIRRFALKQIDSTMPHVWVLLAGAALFIAAILWYSFTAFRKPKEPDA